MTAPRGPVLRGPLRALTREERAATLRRLRLERGWGYRVLARKAHIDRRLLVNLESGKAGLGPKRARRLARALGVSVSALLLAETGFPLP